MNRQIDLISHDSKSELEEHLRVFGGGILVGGDAESPRFFYTLMLTGVSQWLIGLSSSGLGPKPNAKLFGCGKRLIIGHDQSLTFIDVPNKKIIKTIALEGAFYEFVSFTESSAVAIYEIGITKVDTNGNKIWEVVAPNVIEDFHIENEILLKCKIADSSVGFCVSLDDGHYVS